MIIVGGTYSEVCFEPIWEHIYGSGFRAVNVILASDNDQEIEFFTCADNEVKAHMEYFDRLNDKLKINVLSIDKSPTFYYDYPLKTPSILPRPDLFTQGDRVIETEGAKILAYGLLEVSIHVQGEDVVYDPQSPANPKSFLSTGSSAKRLIIVINESEAKKISKVDELKQVVNFFFDIEKCYALLIKMGAKGALLYESRDTSPIEIPVYETNKVFNIGSGDVFSAYFALNWFKGKDLAESAIQASKVTALYCNSKDLSFNKTLKSFTFNALQTKKGSLGQIYLAGPFFTFGARWLINEVWSSFKSFGLNVFSPFHDVGHGKAEDVVDKDLKGLDDSDIVFAIIDGLDAGTLFEVGYAVSQNKPVIAFVQNEHEESLKMLEGTHCIIEQDLTTAIYKTYWSLAKE